MSIVDNCYLKRVELEVTRVIVGRHEINEKELDNTLARLKLVPFSIRHCAL
jgi:hypothetical protein